MNEITKEKAIATIENLVLNHPGMKLSKREWDGLIQCIDVLKKKDLMKEAEEMEEKNVD